MCPLHRHRVPDLRWRPSRPHGGYPVWGGSHYPRPDEDHPVREQRARTPPTSEERALSTAAAEPAPAQAIAARARGLTKAYGSGETAVIVLDAVDVEIARGRFTAVMGPSGSGKSTLMHCLAG